MENEWKKIQLREGVCVCVCVCVCAHSEQMVKDKRGGIILPLQGMSKRTSADESGRQVQRGGDILEEVRAFGGHAKELLKNTFSLPSLLFA